MGAPALGARRRHPPQADGKASATAGTHCDRTGQDERHEHQVPVRRSRTFAPATRGEREELMTDRNLLGDRVSNRALDRSFQPVHDGCG